MQIQFTIQKFVTFVCINSRERTRQRATNSGDDFLVDALTKLDIVVGLTLRLLECAGLNNSVNFIFRLCVSCLVEAAHAGVFGNDVRRPARHEHFRKSSFAFEPVEARFFEWENYN